MTLKSNGKIINALYHPKRYNLPSSKPKQELLASKLGLRNKFARNPLIILKLLIHSFHMTSLMIKYVTIQCLGLDSKIKCQL
jgi:hypothetical protein